MLYGLARRRQRYGTHMVDTTGKERAIDAALAEATRCKSACMHEWCLPCMHGGLKVKDEWTTHPSHCIPSVQVQRGGG